MYLNLHIWMDVALSRLMRVSVHVCIYIYLGDRCERKLKIFYTMLFYFRLVVSYGDLLLEEVSRKY